MTQTIDVETILAACQVMIDRYSVLGGKMWPETKAAIEANSVAVAERLRIDMNVGQWMENAAHCQSCNSVIRSTHRHDFRSCECGRLSVDGGTWYLRRLFSTDAQGWDDRSVQWPWIAEDEAE